MKYRIPPAIIQQQSSRQNKVKKMWPCWLNSTATFILKDTQLEFQIRNFQAYIDLF